MKNIGILSDTHGYLDPLVFDFFRDCDEVWHAGDWGSNVSEQLLSFKPLKGVYGNIDGSPLRSLYPEKINFRCENIKVFIIHIGGYPGKYERRVQEKLQELQPNLFITGHSHILKITRDPKLNNMLHINPGAAGKAGTHTVRTIVRLKVDGKKIFDVEVIELGKR